MPFTPRQDYLGKAVHPEVCSRISFIRERQGSMTGEGLAIHTYFLSVQYKNIHTHTQTHIHTK